MKKRKSGKLKLWYRRRKRARAKTGKHIRTMDIILVVVAVALVTFTIEMIRIFETTGMIPDTLCSCVFAALGGECGAMAWIKTAKERNKDRQRELEDRAHMEKREDAGTNTEDVINGTERKHDGGENLEFPQE